MGGLGRLLVNCTVPTIDDTKTTLINIFSFGENTNLPTFSLFLPCENSIFPLQVKN